DARIAAHLSVEVVMRIVDLVPDDWLEETPEFDGPRAQRAGYVRYLMARLQPPRRFAEEAARAGAALHV
ncbi:MAG TPA: hypothetical protein VEX14_13680, partial [Burkholderiaceae bacterium]|nr:hypothetical protein [Burkholderiaceae bacterium]